SSGRCPSASSSAASASPIRKRKRSGPGTAPPDTGLPPVPGSARHAARLLHEARGLGDGELAAADLLDLALAEQHPEGTQAILAGGFVLLGIARHLLQDVRTREMRQALDRRGIGGGGFEKVGKVRRAEAVGELGEAPGLLGRERRLVVEILLDLGDRERGGTD